MSCIFSQKGNPLKMFHNTLPNNHSLTMDLFITDQPTLKDVEPIFRQQMRYSWDDPKAVETSYSKIIKIPDELLENQKDLKLWSVIWDGKTGNAITHGNGI